MRRSLAVTLAALSLACAVPAAAQPADPAVLIAAQKEAMGSLAALDGVWRGQAWAIDPVTRKRHDLIQTERMGPFLDGTIKIIEGRGYNLDGTVGFNAFAVIAYDAQKKVYTLSSWAMGQSGDFPVELTADGYIWTRPAGPGAVIRYTTTVKGDTLHEVGEYVREGGTPVPIFEMTLQRVGDSDWPAGVPMK